jgi:predicted DNA-binding protein YlxM (UPF0122 family)
MEDNTLQRTMLLDFFGDLLTDKQREYFDLHYNEDLSLAEIAAQSGVSRQGVWDIIRRAETTLLDMEAKTGLVHRDQERRAVVSEIETDMRRLTQSLRGGDRALAEHILARLEDLKQ